ncbi:hypothetical protein HGRIS_000130 [Hohenbuehelia grisea]|uniref:Uncharacterized protein n=1 Tax=Hohenbuehelia grisea TaxID=104357 RepID=A0ABR3JQ55_9AGAR
MHFDGSVHTANYLRNNFSGETIDSGQQIPGGAENAVQSLVFHLRNNRNKELIDSMRNIKCQLPGDVESYVLKLPEERHHKARQVQLSARLMVQAGWCRQAENFSMFQCLAYPEFALVGSLVSGSIDERNVTIAVYEADVNKVGPLPHRAVKTW